MLPQIDKGWLDYRALAEIVLSANITIQTMTVRVRSIVYTVSIVHTAHNIAVSGVIGLINNTALLFGVINHK